MKWAYGVTTVPSRRDKLLPQTLQSLADGGFDKPWLFVDGDNDASSWRNEFSLPVVCRDPNIQIAGNWMLGMYELFLRFPDAERYAMFQDDLVTYRNLRKYLEQCNYQMGTYWNLYSFPHNEALCPMVGATGRRRIGFYNSCQFGKGALGLVFNHSALIDLLSSYYFLQRAMEPRRGKVCLDGGVSTALKQTKDLKFGKPYRELVHNPSLLQHVGLVSSMLNYKTGKDKGCWPSSTQARTFRGTEFDALSLLEEAKHN